MPRGPRLDYPGALHHVIDRGIERRRIFNSRHRRSGHLFQNRFKSTLVDEESYLLEVLRYIHLNPVRSRLAVTLDELDGYPWTGHATILGRREFAAQDVDFVLEQFAGNRREARERYRQFVREGTQNGQIREHFQVTDAELRCRTLRRSVVDARAVFAHVLVRYHGFSLTAVGRYLRLSPQTVARGIGRGDVVLVSRVLNPELFLSL
jgi:hypothetical protein